VEGQAGGSSLRGQSLKTALSLWLPRGRKKQFAFSLHLQILTLQAQEAIQEETR
jgi:hypothetical protein